MIFILENYSYDADPGRGTNSEMRWIVRFAAPHSLPADAVLFETVWSEHINNTIYPDEAPSTTNAVIQGNWELVSRIGEMDDWSEFDEGLLPYSRVGEKWRFDKNKLEVRRGQSTFHCNYEIGSGRPASFDICHEAGHGPIIIRKGICELAGDRLRVCVVPCDLPRPVDLKAELPMSTQDEHLAKTHRRIVYEFKRVQ
jgi:hypothetical protein